MTLRSFKKVPSILSVGTLHILKSETHNGHGSDSVELLWTRMVFSSFS